MDSSNISITVLGFEDFTFRPVKDPLAEILLDLDYECQIGATTSGGILLSARFNSFQLASVLRVDEFEVATASDALGFLTVCAFRKEDLVLLPVDGLGLEVNEYPPVFEVGEYPLFHFFPSVHEAMKVPAAFPGTRCEQPGWLLFGSPTFCSTAISHASGLMVGTWRPSN